MLWKKDVLFCDISPTTYAISEKKEILKRHIKNLTGKEKFCHEYRSDKLPNLLSSYNCGLIKTGKGIDIRLQENPGNFFHHSAAVLRIDRKLY